MMVEVVDKVVRALKVRRVQPDLWEILLKLHPAFKDR